MSARSKIVRDFSGQEVAIPYDPRDDAQHTPGPWELKPIIENPDQPQPLQRHKWEVWHYQADGFPDLFIGEAYETMTRTGEANAALIAAAPETAAERDRLRQVNEVMLEALRYALSDGDPEAEPLAPSVEAKIRAALAAAERE